LFFVNRGAPKAQRVRRAPPAQPGTVSCRTPFCASSLEDEAEWAAVRRSALTLAESGNLLMMRGRAPLKAGDQDEWTKDAKLLADVGTAAYKAAQARDFAALAALTESLDASCTTCHKQYRPNVFPHNGEAKGRSE
jgi:hypothetical protein